MNKQKNNLPKRGKRQNGEADLFVAFFSLFKSLASFLIIPFSFGQILGSSEFLVS